MKNQQNLTTNSTKTLFCIAYEEWRNGKWIPGLEYMHAKDEADARLQFGGTFMGPRKRFRMFRGRSFRVIAAAPVFGFFAKQENQLFV